MRLGDLDALEEKLDELERYVDERYHVWIPVKGVYNAINNTPVIIECGITSDGIPLLDLRPRQQGEWTCCKDFHENCRYRCNQCGNSNNIPSNYCPNCGARMVKNGNE